MKKFNVKVLSMAVTAAVVSGAAGAAERDLASIPEKAQNAMAFQTVFGENTKFDEDTGKFTFDKDSSALLLKTMELEQAVNGFAAGSNFVATNEDGSKTVREATNADIEADSMKGVGLAGGITAVNTRVDNLAKDIDEALDEQDQTVEQLKAAITSNNEHIAKVAGDVAEMGKEVSAKFDEVDEEITKASTELSESIEKVAGDVTAVNKRVDTLEQDTAAAKASAKAAEDKVTELSANVDSKVKEAKDAAKAAEDKVTELSANVDGKVKEAKDAADKAVDAASKIDAVAEKADKASKGVAGLTVALEKVSEQALLAAAENAQALNGFKENDEIVVTDKNGIKSVKTATTEDVEQDEFGGLGLKEVAAKHDQSLADLTAETERAKKAAEQAAFAAIENAQELNGFKDGDEIVVTDDDGVKSTRKATQADVDADGFGGLGLKEVVAAHDEALGDLTETVNENSEALVKTAEVVNAISADVNANKAAIETNKTAIATKADKADVDKLVEYTADMGKKVNDIGDTVTELGDSTKEAIATVEQDIVGLTKGLGLAAEAVEDNRKEIDANKAAIETNKTAIATKADKADVDKLVEYTADMGKKVNDIGDTVTELGDSTKEAIATVEQDIVGLTKGLGLAAEAVEDNRKEIDANKAAIAENTAKLEEQKEANDGFNNAIASLDEDIITLKKADLAAADALKAHRTDIDANKATIETKADKTAVESVKTIAVEAQKSAQTAKGAVEVAQKSAETADSHAKAAQTAAAKAQESADTNAVQIAANTKQIDTNKTDIAALQTANGQHAAGIAKNSARIDSLDKNVANLRKETRQGLAAQAALSGLFQPYSVGKFNVTAALGGFKSDTAVAVGAGYRFNENFAAKAGLAVGTSSGGSASYNVGLNYEW